MHTVRMFCWWFMLGSLMALAVLLIQGGIRDIMLASEPIWNIQLIALLTPIIGGGLLGGCVALILNRIRQPDHSRPPEAQTGHGYSNRTASLPQQQRNH